MVFVPLQFFTGPSMSVEGTLGMLNYRPDGVTPYMLFFKDGVIGEKCVSTWQNLKLKHVMWHLVCCCMAAYCFPTVNKVLRQTKWQIQILWSSGIFQRCYLELLHKILR